MSARSPWGWPVNGTWVRACGRCGLPASEPHDHTPLGGDDDHHDDTP